MRNQRGNGDLQPPVGWRPFYWRRCADLEANDRKRLRKAMTAPQPDNIDASSDDWVFGLHVEAGPPTSRQERVDRALASFGGSLFRRRAPPLRPPVA